MHAPTMHAPTVHAPTIHAPTVHAPSIHAPTVHAPTVHAPTVHAPSVHVPSKVPVKTLGNVTDRMSQAMDAYGYIEKAVHDNEVKKESRLRRLWNVVKSATPSVVRSVILGTILFTVYDEGVVRTRLEEIKNSNEPSELDKQYKHTSWPRVFLFSGVSGAVAGSINGLLFSLWNKASAPRSPCFPLGFMVSHTIVHCALFSSYELLKRMVMRAGSMDYLDYRGCLAVSAVGGVAGAVQEYVNYFTSPLEENGLNKESWNAIKELSRPKFRSFMTLGIVIPNAIGFLAYEYTKDFILEREEDKESPDDEVSPEPLVDTEDLSVGNDSMLLANQFTPATLSPIPMSPINQETQNNLKEAEL